MRFAVMLVLLAATAAADPAPEPAGPHPRLLLDEQLKATWKKQAKDPHSAISRAIDRCSRSRTDPKNPDYQRDSYMGFDWSANLTACLMAWTVTASDEDARSAVKFLAALLDDLEWQGDGKGGERAVRRDTGYAIRSMPPYVALAYDWLHDHPALTGALKTKTLERLDQWLRWYKAEGYHRRSPGTNYHAGYVLAATFAAIAAGGEAGEFNHELWTHLRDDMWGTDMAKAVGPGGLLDGGDFPEGWQYGPLSVAEYAIAYRAASKHGITVDGIDRWLQAMFVRTIHAMTARDTIAAIGDTEEKAPTIPVHPLTLTAILIGPAPPAAQRQAAGEMARLGLAAKEYPLYEALAEAREAKPELAAREKWPTSYFSTGINAFYARTAWGPDGVVLVTTCTPTTDTDHWHPDAGNFTLARGKDEIVIDPSPYGSLSSLTGNAPTILANKLPESYRPSQGGWGQAMHFAWALQTKSGVIATRCDYADAFRFQDEATEIPAAIRDLVIVPWGPARSDATALVIDRAESGSAQQPLYLRFRSLGGYKLVGDTATAKVGGSTLTIKKLTAAGTPETSIAQVGECYDVARTCRFARIPAGEYRVEIPGPTMEAVHALDVAGTADATIETLAAHLYHLRRGSEDAYIATRPVAYSVPATKARHVVLGGTITSAKSGDLCAITATEAAAVQIVTIDAACAITEDPRTGPASPDLEGAPGTLIPVGGRSAQSQRRGCCDAGTGATSPAILLALVLLVWRSRPRRRRGNK